ncbi:MAG: prepilin-type N-terminal cleavage/methylation domain-containing protein [Thermomonas sp.]
MRLKRSARGFSLLEAVVALAILAAAGLAAFAALTQSLQMVGRADGAREADLALRNAVAWIEQVNPMEQSKGRQTMGEFELRWTSRPVEPVRDATTGALTAGLHEVGLYRMQLELWRNGALEREAVLRRIGYRQVRRPAVL